MTTIAELEFCIRSTQTVIKRAEATLERLKAELAKLKTDLQELKQPEQEQENLLGRWATHPTYGRGITCRQRADSDSHVEVAFLNSGAPTGTLSALVSINTLTLDPVTLTTTEELDDAPNRTIIEDDFGNSWTKRKGEWESGWAHVVMLPCRVIRWGDDK